MKNQIQLTVAVTLLTVATGCGEYGVGGGAYQPTSVVVLPPDLGVTGEAASAESEDAEVVESTSAGSGPGAFAGRVVLTGSAPTLSPLIAQGSDVKDAAVCAAAAQGTLRGNNARTAWLLECATRCPVWNS